MKNLKYIVLSILLSFCYQSVTAQEVKFYMKDKNVLKIPYLDLDSIVAYDKTAVTSEWVDLGLPSGLLWASHNVGATVPEEYGDYFAWGEIAPKTSYDEENSLTFDKTMTDFSGDPKYDVATANWGAPARMPKKSEIQELIDNCTTTWTTRNGVNGRLVTGKNGKSIFLPVAGYRRGTSLSNVGDCSFYWSSTPDEDNAYYAYRLYFDGGIFGWGGYGDRCDGFPVRPVREN